MSPITTLTVCAGSQLEGAFLLETTTWQPQTQCEQPLAQPHRPASQPITINLERWLDLNA